MNQIFKWVSKFFRTSSYAEDYLSKSIDNVDFICREKYLREKGLL